MVEIPNETYYIVSNKPTLRTEDKVYAAGEDYTRLMCFLFMDEAEQHAKLCNSIQKDISLNSDKVSDVSEYKVYPVRIEFLGQPELFYKDCGSSKN